MKVNYQKLWWGFPLIALFSASGFFIAAKQEFVSMPVPASLYWMSLLKGILFAAFMFFVTPVLVQGTLRMLKQK